MSSCSMLMNNANKIRQINTLLGANNQVKVAVKFSIQGGITIFGNGSYLFHISNAVRNPLHIFGKAKFVYTKYHFQLILIRFPTRLSLPVRAKRGGGTNCLVFFSHLLFSGKKPPSSTKCMWSGCRLFITPTRAFLFIF